MAERLAARPEALNLRRETVEHPFGSIKQWMGQGAFLTIVIFTKGLILRGVVYSLIPPAITHCLDEDFDYARALY